MEFRNRLIENYDEIFGSGGNNQPSLDRLSVFNRKWGWYQSLFTGLAQGDIRRIEDITKLNLHSCLYALAYIKDKSEVEAAAMKNKIK